VGAVKRLVATAFGSKEAGVTSSVQPLIHKVME